MIKMIRDLIFVFFQCVLNGRMYFFIGYYFVYVIINLYIDFKVLYMYNKIKVLFFQLKFKNNLFKLFVCVGGGCS